LGTFEEFVFRASATCLVLGGVRTTGRPEEKVK